MRFVDGERSLFERYRLVAVFKAGKSRVLDKLVGSRVDALGSGVDGDIARGEEFRKTEERRSIESR